MKLEYAGADPFDPTKSIDDNFGGRKVAFLFAVFFEEVDVEIRRNPDCKPADKPGFPKDGISLLEEPTQIMVIPWQASPGCRSCVINGKLYECCS